MTSNEDMSEKAYYLDEFSEDHALHPLAQKAKEVLHNLNRVFKIYEDYKPELFGFSSQYIACLMNLNNIRFVSSCEKYFLSILKHANVSLRLDTSNEISTTPVKTNPNVSNLQRRLFLFQNVGYDLSQNVIQSPLIQPTPVKVILSSVEPETLSQEYASLISAEDCLSSILNEVSRNVIQTPDKQPTSMKAIAYAVEPEALPQECRSFVGTNKTIEQADSMNQGKDFTPMKVHQISKEPKIFLYEPTPPRRKEINYNEPIETETTLLTKRPTIIKIKNIDKAPLTSVSEIGDICHNVQDTGGSRETDVDTTFEKPDESVAISPVVSVVPKANPSLSKVVADEGVSADSNNNIPKEKTTTLGNQKSFRLEEETKQDIQGSTDDNKECSSVSKVETSTHPTIESQKSICSDNAEEMTSHLNEDSEKNVSPKQGSNLVIKGDRKRKSPSPSVLNKSLLKMMPSSGTVESDLPFTSTPKQSVTTSSNSSLEYKSAKTMRYSIDEQISPKNMRFQGCESTPGCSKESSLPKGNITTSPPVPAIKQKLTKSMHVYGCESPPGPSKEISPLPKANITTSPPVPACKQKLSIDKRLDGYESQPGCSKEMSPLSKSNITTSPSVPACKQKSSKDKRFDEYESQPGCSKEMSPLSKGNITTSPTVPACKQKLPKDKRFGEYESQPGCSKEMSPKSKSNVFSSPRVVAIRSSPISDEQINLLKEWLTYCSPVNLSSIIQNFDSNSSEYCLAQFKTLLTRRKEYLAHIFNRLLSLREQLEFLCHYLQVVTQVVHRISLLSTDHVPLELQERFIDLIKEASKLVRKLSSLQMSVALEIQYWVSYSQQSRTMPILSSDKHSVSIECLQLYEGDMKKTWRKMDRLVRMADVQRSNFLETENDFNDFVNLFNEILIAVQILKPFSPNTP